jgi:hypothetical protein
MAADSLLRLHLGLPRRLQLETAKLERQRQRARGSLVPLVQAKLRELLQQANLRTWVRLRVKAKRPSAADSPSLGLRRASWGPPLLVVQARAHWQAKSRATPRTLLPAMRRGLLQASSLETRPAPLGANSRVMRGVLFQANSRVKTVDPPSPGLRRAS